MDLNPGDVIAAFSPTVSKKKYHLCVVGFEGQNTAQFLFLNSEYKFESDLKLSDGEIENLPESRTGDTVISFSDIIRFNRRHLELYKAVKLTTISDTVAEKICKHVSQVPTLTRRQRNLISELIGIIANNSE